MTSIKQRFGGYLKQFVGEVTGSQTLHEKGKSDVLGAASHETEIAEFRPGTGRARHAGEAVGSTGAIPTPAPGNQSAAVDRDSASRLPGNGKEMQIYTQMLPEIEPGHGPYVKVSSGDTVVYVAALGGDTFGQAKNAIVRLADNLKAKPDKANTPIAAQSNDQHHNDRDTNRVDDIEDQLEIGLEDSFPASDPPAAVAKTSLPKKRAK